MLNEILAGCYERDIRRLIDELQLFSHEADIWRTQGAVKNSSGNLALHIIGGTNYLIGTLLANTGYVRNREQEFIKKAVPRSALVAELEALIPLIKNTLNEMGPAQMEAAFPIPFDDMEKSNSYVLIQLSLHLNYHLGQVNYLRRMLA